MLPHFHSKNIFDSFFDKEEYPLVTVVIVNWNGEKYISETLNGLSNQKFKLFTIKLIDNGSTDGSVELIQKFYPEVEIISFKNNVGFCRANNFALECTESKYIALLNNDAVPGPMWLWNLVYALENCPEAGFAASKILSHDNPHIIDRIGDGYSFAGAGILKGRGSSASLFMENRFVFGACAAAALYRREMLLNIGFFDDTFFLIYEDVDLSFRAQLMGFKCLFVHEAVVFHMVSKSIQRDSDISIYFGHRNLEWVYFKNMPTILILFTLLFHFLYGLISLVYFSAKGRCFTFLTAKKDALVQIPLMVKKRRKIQKKRKVSNSYILKLMENENFAQRAGTRKKPRF